MSELNSSGGRYHIQSFEHFKFLAEKGDADAQLSVAMMYHSILERNKEGLGIAFNMFRKLAEQGSSKAQIYLGLMFQFGEGIEQDPTKAVYWIRKAAEKGDGEAQGILGNLYAEGEGVEVNCVQAYKRFKIAEACGFFEYGDGIFDTLEKQMTGSEIEEANNLAEAWKKQNRVVPMDLLN
jgi:TPR repeat protein|tara:strand:+ start:357 stop:896 length:540 start_codon:yes stop_codon:yes gene_type:complete